MSQKQHQQPSNPFDQVSDPRLKIFEDDVNGLVEMFKQKGFADADVVTLYVVGAVGVSVDDEPAPTEAELKQMGQEIDRMVYDEKNQRLVGFIPPLNMVGK